MKGRLSAQIPTGSSPLARGLPLRLAVRVGEVRIIPARAGFTPSRSDRPIRPSDHPRSRGVYEEAVSKAGNVMGSSPLARGLPQGLLELLGDRRIIPARAGFTGSMSLGYMGCPDHPRSRGVYGAPLALKGVGCGSSPLARGLHSALVLPRALSGIIPARAGFTR